MKDIAEKCPGCGADFQSDDPAVFGFIPPVKDGKTEVPRYCQRCFRIRHYNEIAPVSMQELELDEYQLFDKLADKQGLVVQIVDLFDFAGSIISGIHRHIGQKPLYLLVNKIDLFPKSTNQAKCRAWIMTTLKEQGIRPIDVRLCSAEKGWNVEEAWQDIEKYRQSQDVIVVGTANVGKSTIINQWVSSDHPITTSRYPGTTLQTIHIPLADGKELIDTPGVLRKDRLSEWLTPSELKQVLPKKRLNPTVYQLHDQQTLFFGGLVRLDYVQGNKQPFVCYVANSLRIHRTKLLQADMIQRKHRGDWLVPPTDSNRLPPWRKHRLSLSGKQFEDVVIAGLGFIRTGKQKAIIDVWAPEGIQVTTRPSII